VDLQQLILSDHSKATRNAIIAWVGDDVQRVAQLIDCMYSDNMRLSQRAAWPVGILGEVKQHLIEPHLPKMIEELGKPQKHNSIYRNTLRVLQFIDIPEAHLGSVINHCARFLEDPKAAIAFKAFAMTVFYNATKKHPELGQELKQLIELNMPYASSGVKSRGRKILNKLD